MSSIRDEMYEKYDALREEYLELFGIEAPEYKPIETEFGIEEIQAAIKAGFVLEDMPEGAVT